MTDGKPTILTPSQMRQLRRIWFLYGNGGAQHSDADHKFIQRLIDQQLDTRDFYHPSAACLSAVDAVLTTSAQ